jgi:hypothetical protein
MGREEVRGVDDPQVVVLGPHRDVGEDADAEPGPDVFLDDIGVAGGQRDVRRHAGLGEELQQRRRSREAEGVGDDRVLPELREGRLRDACERMGRGHHDGAPPAVHRDPDQLLEQRIRAGRHHEVDALVRHHVGDLLGGALMEVDSHAGESLTEAPQDRRQHIAGLGMGGGDRERALFVAAHLGGETADVRDLAQDHPGAGDDLVAGRRGAHQRARPAGEELQAELLLQQAQLLADAGLRGVQRLRGRGDVEPGVRDGDEIA